MQLESQDDIFFVRCVEIYEIPLKLAASVQHIYHKKKKETTKKEKRKKKGVLKISK